MQRDAAGCDEVSPAIRRLDVTTHLHHLRQPEDGHAQLYELHCAVPLRGLRSLHQLD
eukprot:CAMPEP_0181211410 /NCGR_PEP_ID=MMETSP1096-20121128/23768_1 /TAXON_ID=156174 ORGANISM="Chrysochromulina ericina, Strain CCMP281" /NCGR_SAMPLE_ID=MMETSP1096 /ASSEMBLY_ACC=CAM_ASM_000453 /LENGTH=56 /DNA_ID=CAMNT_0023302803 /DNA_START=873 /DNA_END=1043 /DNA_ORIENTATION=-